MSVSFLAATGPVRAAAPRPLSALVAGFERDLERLARRDRVPGAAAAIVHGGDLVWEGVSGVADRESGTPIDGSTQFQVASLTKPVTALAVLLLVEDGRLDLDRPVWDYIESWRPKHSGHDPRSVTARLLLAHRAGVGVHGYPGYAPDRPLPTLIESLDGRNGSAFAAMLVAEPNSGVRYSSGGYAILQLLIEEISGEPFAAFVGRRVLRPLGMTHSSFEPSPALSSATGHGWWGGRLPAYRFREQAASGLWASAGDLGRFLTVLWSPAAQASVGVERATIAAMLEPPAPGGFALGFAIDASATRFLGGEVMPGDRIVWHNGSNRGFRAVLGAAPDRGDAFVVLTNSDRGLAMTNDLFCSWGEWLTGLESASCWVERKRRGTLVALAGLVGLGAVMDGAALVRRLLHARSAPAARGAPAAAGAPVERHAWASWLRLGISVAVLAGWWLYWYSDRLALLREGIDHFVPASAQPPTLFWLTAVVTAWCLLGVARWRVTRTPRGGALALGAETGASSSTGTSGPVS